MTDDNNVLLDIRDLRTYFYTQDGVVKAVDGVSFHVKRGEVVGLVGESGCGKSVTSFSILRLVGYPGKIVSGEILFEGRDILKMSDKEITALRGDRISMIFQQPTSCLNPVFDAGFQLGEVGEIHQQVTKRRKAVHTPSICCAWWASQIPSGVSPPSRTSFLAEWRNA